MTQGKAYMVSWGKDSPIRAVFIGNDRGFYLFEVGNGKIVPARPQDVEVGPVRPLT